jgi:hypothetical protein
MENYFLIYNRIEYEAGIETGLFDFTIDDLDRAENSSSGLVGKKNGVDFYLSKNIPTNNNKIKNPTDEQVIQSIAKELMDIQAYAWKKNIVIKSVSLGASVFDSIDKKLTPTPSKIVGIYIVI